MGKIKRAGKDSKGHGKDIKGFGSKKKRVEKDREGWEE